MGLGLTKKKSFDWGIILENIAFFLQKMGF